MMPCRFVDVFVSVLPLRAFRDAVLLRHAEKCPVCQKKLLSEREARSWIFEAKDVGADPDFWLAVKERIRRQEEVKTLRPPLIFPRVQKWAAVTGLALLAAAGFLIVRSYGPRTIPPGGGGPTRFRLNYLKVDSESIEPVVIQLRDTDLVIIWVDGTR